MSDIETRLKNPLPATNVHWRVGSTTKDKSKGIASLLECKRRHETP